MKQIWTLLSDAEIEAEAELIGDEMIAGNRMDVADVAARFGISLDDALALAAEYASELHGMPMMVIRRNEVN